jgi:hypothetical protein
MAERISINLPSKSMAKRTGTKEAEEEEDTAECGYCHWGIHEDDPESVISL